MAASHARRCRRSTFEDLISRDFPDRSSVLAESLSIYQNLSHYVRASIGSTRHQDTLSGNLGVFNTALRVPRFERRQTRCKFLDLADQIETVPSRLTGTGQFVLQFLQSRPAQPRVF